jgi:hypothetical protein
LLDKPGETEYKTRDSRGPKPLSAKVGIWKLFGAVMRTGPTDGRGEGGLMILKEVMLQEGR